jgi:hypothetical protein
MDVIDSDRWLSRLCTYGICYSIALGSNLTYKTRNARQQKSSWNSVPLWILDVLGINRDKSRVPTDEKKNMKKNTKTIFVICLLYGPKGSPACLAWGGAAWKKARLEWAEQGEE